MWTLPQELFDEIKQHIPWTVEIDLMASHLNAKVQKYCSHYRDPHAYRTNAFSIKLTDLRSYCFPPFSLIDAILSTIEEDKVRYFALIAPVHVGAHWYPRLMSHLAATPLLLPPETARKLFLPWDKSIRCRDMNRPPFFRAPLDHIFS